MNFTEAKYAPLRQVINCKLDGVPINVPVDPSNRHYQEIMRLVDAGELTIQEPSE
jgi:hypothetical protein